MLHKSIAVFRKTTVMDQKTEAEIVARVLKGEKQAYALLVDEYKAPIYNLAYRIIGNFDDAEDMAQETFLRAFQQLSRYDMKRRYFTWLYTISLNLIRNHLKKTGRGRKDDRHANIPFDGVVSGTEPFAFHEAADSDELRKEQEEELERCLLKLSPELRELIVLRFYQGLSFEGITEITGLSLSAVKMRVYRGLETLRELIRKNVTSGR
ncbi:MAG: RNA polymerase [Deltaproteobacteria bacterium HGW-Deltaproteobacteria-13]|jgi:RNA polymerase sigma-70 factor (ECF subfamily)|nr:MAG: RNA polymerase [Deltaproteobacteria bacterium HGW-Deltaproteobacteria-13]